MNLEDNSVKQEILRLINEGMSLSQIESHVGVSRSSISRFVNKKTYKDWWEENSKPIAAGYVKDHREDIPELSGNRFIITSAQNNTYVHRQFLQSLEELAKRVDAKIIVGTFSYNTNGFQNLSKGEAEWFDPMITKYILDEPAVLCEGLSWCGELNILPTAVNPLSGLHSYTKGSSGIVPHAKLQLESLPTHKMSPARMMYTTGAVTKRNYIQKKSGQKASFHHVFGALIVEIDDDGDWFVRQLVADSETGEFYDLETLYTPNGYVTDQRIEAINWGDLHSEKKDSAVYATSFGRVGDCILDDLKPKYQFLHDVLDFKAKNHHNLRDPYFIFRTFMQQEDSVKENVIDVTKTMKLLDRPWCQTVVVESNHDLALKRWLKESDYKTDPLNAIFFLECQLAQYKAIANREPFSVFEHAVKTIDPSLEGVKFLKTDERFEICGPDGIECGQHGHLGVNGSRGNINAYQKLGIRYNIGHSHSAAIKDGVYQAGVSGEMNMEYNVGGSSWSHSHILTYSNGKRAIVTLSNGKYKA